VSIIVCPECGIELARHKGKPEVPTPGLYSGNTMIYNGFITCVPSKLTIEIRNGQVLGDFQEARGLIETVDLGEGPIDIEPIDPEDEMIK